MGDKGTDITKNLQSKIKRLKEELKYITLSGREYSDSETESILRKRAAELYESGFENTESENGTEAIVFKTGNETYAVDTNYLSEVFPFREITKIPCTPPYILGVVNYRGKIISVTDLKKLFDIQGDFLNEKNRILILKKDKMELGVFADEVIGMILIDEDRLQRSLSSLKGIRERYLKGITPERIVYLDAGKLLGDPKLIVNETI